jgi:hypothetical protein
MKGKGDPYKYMIGLGQRYHQLGLIDHREAISQINFKNAVHYLNQEYPEIRNKESENFSEAREKLTQLSQRIYDLSRYKD